MRVWIDKRDAQVLRDWALEQDRDDLADRFFRAEIWEWKVSTPLLWRWRDSHRLLFRCPCCLGWEAFKRHGNARKNGWVRYQVNGPWLHEACLAEWRAHSSEILHRRWEEKQRRDKLESLFRQPELLSTYDGVLVRSAPWYEHTSYGLLDGTEAQINADFGTQRMYRVIDEMPEELRERLVASAFLGFHFKYHLLLGWVEAVPPEYDDVELDSPDDVRCQSVLVDELPRRLRDELPAAVRAQL